MLALSERSGLWVPVSKRPAVCCECGDRILWDSVQEMHWQRADSPDAFPCADCWEPEA